MKVVAVVQARVGSTRLPAKVLKPLGGRTVLEQVLKRLSGARLPDEMVLATTTQAEDDVLEKLAEKAHVRVVRGPVSDVLARFVLAAQVSGADHVVRITADCPCVDPDVVDRVIAHHLACCADYTSNIHPRTFPRGLDVEVVSRPALEQAHQEAAEPPEREHVTPFLWNRPQRFRLANLRARPEETMPELRVTLDTWDDYVMLQALFDEMGRDDFCTRELVNLARSHPWLKACLGTLHPAPPGTVAGPARMALDTNLAPGAGR